MGRKFVVTEDQYKALMAEGVVLNADVSSTNGDVAQAVENTKQEAQKNGVDLRKATIQMPASTNESVYVSAKTLSANRLKALKESSMVVTIKDFAKMNI